MPSASGAGGGRRGCRATPAGCAGRGSSGRGGPAPGGRTARWWCWWRTRRPAGGGCRRLRTPCAPPRSTGRSTGAKRAMRADAMRVVGGGHRRPDAPAPLDEVGDGPGVLDVHADDEAAGVGLGAAHLEQAAVGVLAAPTAIHWPSAESAVRRRWLARARSRSSSKSWEWNWPSAPTHSMWPLMRGKCTGPHHAAVAEGVAVAVLEVGHGLLPLVGDERDGLVSDRNGVPDSDSRPAGAGEGDPQAVAPGPVVAGVVDLVEHDEPAVGDLRPAPPGWTPPAGRW